MHPLGFDFDKDGKGTVEDSRLKGADSANYTRPLKNALQELAELEEESLRMEG